MPSPSVSVSVPLAAASVMFFFQIVPSEVRRYSSSPYFRRTIEYTVPEIWESASFTSSRIVSKITPLHEVKTAAAVSVKNKAVFLISFFIFTIRQIKD